MCFQFMDRTSPMDKHMEVMINRYGLQAAPATAQMFGNAGKEHMEKYGDFFLSKTKAVFTLLKSDGLVRYGVIFFQAQSPNTLPKSPGKTTSIPQTTRKILFVL